MILSKNLKKQNIIIKSKSSTRWDLIEEMLDLVIKNNDVKKEQREPLKTALIEREKSMSTGIGRGVAIPHCTTDAVSELIVALAFCENGIDFDSIDNQPVKIVVFLLVPKDKFKQHLKTLANIAKLMNHEKLREQLSEAKKPENVIKIIKNFEKEPA